MSLQHDLKKLKIFKSHQLPYVMFPIHQKKYIYIRCYVVFLAVFYSYVAANILRIFLISFLYQTAPRHNIKNFPNPYKHLKRRAKRSDLKYNPRLLKALACYICRSLVNE